MIEIERKAFEESMRQLNTESEISHKKAVESTIDLIKAGLLAHTWVFKKGGRIDGRFVSADDKNVSIKKAGYSDDRVYTLSISELCDEDQQLVAKLNK